MTERPVLFVSGHLPSGRSRQAGQQLAYEHLRMLAAKRRVTLVSFATPFEIEDRDANVDSLCSDIHIVPISRRDRLVAIAARPHLPLKVAFRARNYVADLLDRLDESLGTPPWWIEYEAMAQYAVGRAGRAARSVMVCHDVESQMLQRRADDPSAGALTSRLFSLEAARMRRWEKRTLPQVGKIIAFSSKDQALLEELGCTNSVVGFPRIGEKSPSPSTIANDSAPTLLYYGAMSRRENEDAMVWFLSEVWPLIRTRIENAQLLIVGSGPSARLQAEAKQTHGVTVTGFVEDATSYFSRAWVAIAPLRLGAGVKVKVLEYMRAGLPVVATPVGAEGIPAGLTEGMQLCAESGAFADHCSTLLASPHDCRQAGAAAHRFYADVYSPRQLDAPRIEELMSVVENALR